MPNLSRPLDGVRVAVTRPLPQAEDLAGLLREAGADVVIAPLIRLEAPVDGEPLRAAIRDLAAFDWIVFSSANGVSRFMAALTREGVGAGALREVGVACVGPATAAVARAHGLQVAVIPDEYVGDAIASALAARTDLRGKRILLARAAAARAALPERLRDEGAIVCDVAVYRSTGDAAGVTLLQRHIAEGAVDAITLTSGSAVRYFVKSVGLPGKAVIAVIGPVSGAAARDHGLDVVIEAQPHTTEGLVAGLVKYFAPKRT